ncbi:MAG: hypothetical protein ACRDUX_05715 [Mycobacterium sp.]
MKLQVVTDNSGNVVGTYEPPEHPGKDDPVFHIGAGPDQVVREVDVPSEFSKIESAQELHRRLGEYLTRDKRE